MVETIQKYKVLVKFCILFCDMKNIITPSPRMKCCVCGSIMCKIHLSIFISRIILYKYLLFMNVYKIINRLSVMHWWQMYYFLIIPETISFSCRSEELCIYSGNCEEKEISSKDKHKLKDRKRMKEERVCGLKHM